MLRIGLTGGIASGKSTVAGYFADLDVPVIDLDQLSKEVVEKGTSAIDAISAHFGHQILLSDGNLDRKQLRAIIFADPEEKQWLEGLLHPLIRDRQEALLSATQSAYAVIEVPLLVENQLQENFDRVLVVATDEQHQIDRGSQRDNAEVSDIESILASQATAADRIKIADDIIENNGSLSELKDKVLVLHQQYKKMVESGQT